MRTRVRRPLRTAVTVVFTVSIVLSWVSPASGTSDDVIGHPNTGDGAINCSSDSDSVTSGHGCDKAADNNESTYLGDVATGNCGGGVSTCGYREYGFQGTTQTNVTIRAFRIHMLGGPASGNGAVGHTDNGEATQDFTLKIRCNTNGNYNVAYFTTANVSGDYDSGMVQLTTPCTFGGGNSYRVYIKDGYYLTNGGDWRVYSFEAYETYTAAVGIEHYMFNMRVDHPQFQWTASWGWAVSWHGSFVIGPSPSGTWRYSEGSPQTNTGAHTFTSVSANAGNTGVNISQDCFPLCQSDSFTVVINDTDRNQTATYTFQRSADGAIQPPVRVPQFTSWAGCYNVAAEDCDADFDPTHAQSSGAGTTDIKFAWVGTVSNVQAGPRSRTNPSLFGTVRYTSTGQTEGSYAAYGLTTSTAQNPEWMICATNQINSTCVDIHLTYGTGGVTSGGTSTPTGSQQSSCGSLDPLCGLREVFNVGAEFVTDQVSGGVDSLRQVALSKQPFNFMVRASDGIGTQLAAAQAAVTSTSTCSGLTITLPWASFAPSTMFPGAPDITFSILKCADLEPVVGTSWYQAIRTAMDPALYLLFAWHQVQRFRPKPTMNG